MSEDGPATLELPSRHVLRFEILVVLAVVVLPWTLRAVYSIAGYATMGRVSQSIVPDLYRDPWLDVALQCVLLVGGTMGVALVAYVLMRSGESLRTIGLFGKPSGRDVGRAIGLVVMFIVIGVLVGYLVRSILGLGSPIRSVRWIGAEFVPVGIVASARAALAEEIVVCGYLIHRLRQLGWSDRKALFTSTGIRASYHVYGGVGLVAFTVVFGLVLGRFYERTHRLWVVVLTHFLYDALVFTVALLA